MKNQVLFLMIILFCISGICSKQPLFAGSDLFAEVERIELEKGGTIYNEIKDIDKLSTGFVALFNRSDRGRSDLLIKFSDSGKILAEYGKLGGGPGELRHVTNVLVVDNAIFAIEFLSPWIHEFNDKLEFVKDHRIKKGGHLYDLGSFYGVWGPNYHKDKKYMLELYKKENFEFHSFAFEVDDFPDLVQGWGGLCPIEGNRFAGVYSNIYGIFEFDKHFTAPKKILNSIPSHIKKYYRMPGSPSMIDNSSVKWMRSWSIMSDLFFLNDIYIICYAFNTEGYFDIVSKSGELIKGNLKFPREHKYMYHDGRLLWAPAYRDVDDDHTCFVVKDKPLLGNYIRSGE